MTDLRDQLPAFEAAARRLLGHTPRLVLVAAPAAHCHPDRPVNARGMCKPCYEAARWRGTLHDRPTLVVKAAEFIADYTLLRSEGHTRRQIAERLGMTYPAVTAAYLRAVRAGHLTPDRRPA